MANQVDLVNLGIYLFVGLAMVANGLVALLLWLGAVDLLVIAIVLIFVSNAQLIATLGLWGYTGHTAAKSRPALLVLAEIARRAEIVLSLSTPIFDFLEEAAYRFQWSREARAEWLEEKIENLRDKLEVLRVPEEPTEAETRAFFRNLGSSVKEFFTGWRKEGGTPTNPKEEIRRNTVRGRRLE